MHANEKHCYAKLHIINNWEIYVLNELKQSHIPKMCFHARHAGSEDLGNRMKRGELRGTSMGKKKLRGFLVTQPGVNLRKAPIPSISYLIHNVIRMGLCRNISSV